MKKSYSFIIILISVIIVSNTGCEKDPIDSTTLLVGVWDQVSTTTINYYDNVKQNESTRTYEPGYLVMEIYNNGTAKKYLDGKISDELYWKVEGDLLIMTGSNGTIVNTAFTVDETDLSIKWAIEGSSDGHLLRTDYMSVYKKQ